MSETARRLVVLLATLAGMAVTVRLGLWQLDRAAQKEALQASRDERERLPPLDARDLASTPAELLRQTDRRVRLRGRWLAGATVYLDNRPLNGRPGFFVVTPLRLEPGASAADAVLVQRGWVARDPAERTRLPTVATPEGIDEVVGRVAGWPGRLYDFGGGATGPIRQNIDPVAYARESGLRLRPLSLVQLDEPGHTAKAQADGLLRQWPRPAVDIHKHYGYAVQWFALGALMAGLYVWFQVVRPRLGARG